MPPRRIEHAGEPSLPEMLADPIVQVVMARDGVTRDEVEGLIRITRRKFARIRTEHHHTNRQGSAEPAIAE